MFDLKVELSVSKNACFICFSENPLKMIGNTFYLNTFYFIVKALFLLKIFKFFSRIFGHVEKAARLER